MGHYSAKEKFSFCYQFFKNGESYVQTFRKFVAENGKEAKCPSEKSLKNWVKNLFKTGSVEGISHKKPSQKLEEAKLGVKEIVENEPKISVRRLSLITGSSVTTAWRALRAMKYQPYKLRSVQHLEILDHDKRRQFCQNELERTMVNPNHLKNLIFSDKAHFHLDGGVNRHNCRMWSIDNPGWFENLPLHSPRVTVWGAMSHDEVDGPYFFEGTVTGQS